MWGTMQTVDKRQGGEATKLLFDSMHDVPGAPVLVPINMQRGWTPEAHHRYPVEFRRETVLVLWLQRQKRLPRDVGVLLIRALADLYVPRLVRFRTASWVVANPWTDSPPPAHPRAGFAAHWMG